MKLKVGQKIKFWQQETGLIAGYFTGKVVSTNEQWTVIQTKSGNRFSAHTDGSKEQLEITNGFEYRWITK